MPRSDLHLVALVTALMRWHLGKKIVPGGKKKPFWMNRWLAHPCADLALPFELGIRAMGHTNGR